MSCKNSASGNTEGKKNNTQSRTLKALSNALLIYHLLKEGFAIKFMRTRISNYALKVIRGIKIMIGDKEADMDDFNFVSRRFTICMRFITDDCKMKNKQSCVVDKELIDHYWKSIDSIPSCAKQSKRTIEKNCRNREASFSNYMAYTLIQLGYKLKICVSKTKQSSKVLQFYTWKGLINAQGEYYSSGDDDLLINLVETVNRKLVHDPEVIVDQTIFLEMQTELKPATLSVFKPVGDSYEYTVYCHPIGTADKKFHPFLQWNQINQQ